MTCIELCIGIIAFIQLINLLETCGDPPIVLYYVP